MTDAVFNMLGLLVVAFGPLVLLAVLIRYFRRRRMTPLERALDDVRHTRGGKKLARAVEREARHRGLL